MNTEFGNPIISSRHHEGRRPEDEKPQGKKPGVVIVAVLVMGMGLAAFFFVSESEPQENQLIEMLETESVKREDELAVLPIEIKELVEEPTQIELATANEYYKRALQKEKGKDYEGAIQDYTATIEKAKKYSAEMWNALNNRGIIKVEQFKDYKGAIKDFSRIIQIETNRYDGSINDVRLEAGYTNRAYVKMKQGNRTGACDDLYEALALGVESSVTFIENQLAKNCE